MRTGTYLCSILFLVFASTSYAQTDLLPDAPDLVDSAVQIKQAVPKLVDEASDKVYHLEQAANHLEAAGLNSEAQRLRSQATSLRNQRQLKEKLKALQELQDEIRKLYRLTGVVQQIQVDVKLIEFDLEKLATDGVKLCEFNVEVPKCNSCKQEAPEKLFDEHGQFSTTGQRLRKAGVFKVIAEPSLITTPGQPANLLSGGEFPILIPQQSGKTSVEWHEFGTRIESVTAVMPDGKIRLELQVEASHRDFNNAINISGNVVPGLTCRCINTHVLAEPGKTILIGGQRSLQSQEKSKGGKITKKCLTVAVTPTLLSIPKVNPGKSATESDGNP
ncbi:hypothetical protein [Gimesia aquarii]|uniref:Outer membrane porin HofQ n=1 Tax=Gimesia aquarii TaxID=2527964 RepID=A0A517X331_9PLAN|nr:hypothetical protein [Gimesia aquarii]QDU11914.1 outer membrane porin HofQ [Gimesia aquarii]